MLKVVPSPRQQVVYDTWKNTDQNILIQAVAGGAKTTTLMGILALCEYRTLFLAFNKSIQEEISHRIEKAEYTHAKAMTLHSLGLQAIKYHYGNGKVIVNANKNYDLLRTVQNYNKKLFADFSWEEKAKVNITLMEMNDISRLFLTNSKDEIFAYMDTMDKYYYEAGNIEELWGLWLQIREWSYDEPKLVVDFIDMIYLPVNYNLLIPIQPYYLAIDEAQDLNLVQHKFISNLIDQGDIHKWVAVGDRNQAIYGFSGSYASSFDKFRERENVVELPLDVCYRCPSSIIREANRVYNVMTGFKSDEGIVGEIDQLIHIKPGSMVICRNTAPLLDVYFSLFSLDKKVYLKGEDLANTINRLLKPYQYKTISQTKIILTHLYNEANSIVDMSKEQRIKMYKLKDNLKIFTILAKNYPDKKGKIQDLLTKFDALFNSKEDPDSITLCTIHKSKGLEADIVYILNENLIPSKFAVSPSQLEQEENLRYVARTRAKKEMYYLNLDLNE